jgi:hypothetical protein
MSPAQPTGTHSASARTPQHRESDEAARLPLIERKDAGLRALVELREALTGARGGRPIIPRSFSHSRFPKRESSALPLIVGAGLNQRSGFGAAAAAGARRFLFFSSCGDEGGE